MAGKPWLPNRGPAKPWDSRRGPFGGGHAQQLLDPRELHARPALGLASGALVAVDRFPAGVGDEVGLALAQERLDGFGIWGIGCVDDPR
jgi:hypothetical protein